MSAFISCETAITASAASGFGFAFLCVARAVAVAAPAFPRVMIVSFFDALPY
jgi:hypothetical protein